MKTLNNVSKWAATAMLLGTFGNVCAETIVNETGVNTTVDGHTQSEIVIGVHVDEIYGISGCSYQSVSPTGQNGTYLATSALGNLSIQYRTNAPGKIHVAPKNGETTFKRNGLDDGAGRAVEYYLKKGSESTTPGATFISDTLPEVTTADDATYSLEVWAKTNVTLGGRYTGSVVISFVPDAAAPANP